MPQISVIVPVYNVELYLRPCIDSVLKQSFTDFDIILVDDGSQDSCAAICDDYSHYDKRVHVIHQNNMGVSAARNAGIDYALRYSDSKWIAFVDSDDVISVNYLFFLVQAIEIETADISICSYSEFSGENVPTEQPKENLINCDLSMLSGVEACKDVYSDFSRIGISVWGKLFKKDSFHKIRFPIGKIHEDQAIIPILLYHASTVAILDRNLYFYRARCNSIMHSEFSASRFDDVEAIDACISFFESKEEYELIKLAKRKKSIILAEYNLFARIHGVYHCVPPKYRMNAYAAIRYLRHTLPDIKYTFQLAKIHPKLVHFHEYIRKIKKTLHIPCK